MTEGEKLRRMAKRTARELVEQLCKEWNGPSMDPEYEISKLMEAYADQKLEEAIKAAQNAGSIASADRRAICELRHGIGCGCAPSLVDEAIDAIRALKSR